MMTGNELRELRISLGLTQKQLEKVLCVASPCVCRWEAKGDEEIPHNVFNRELLRILKHCVGVIEAEEVMKTEEALTLFGQNLLSSCKKSETCGIYLILKGYHLDNSEDS